MEAGKSGSTLFTGIAPGTYEVNTECERLRWGHIRWRPAYVTVSAPDQLLDAMDGMLAGAGSSALTSDPTLR